MWQQHSEVNFPMLNNLVPKDIKHKLLAYIFKQSRNFLLIYTEKSYPNSFKKFIVLWNNGKLFLWVQPVGSVVAPAGFPLICAHYTCKNVNRQVRKCISAEGREVGWMSLPAGLFSVCYGLCVLCADFSRISREKCEKPGYLDELARRLTRWFFRFA